MQQEPRRHGVTPRCILIGLLLMPVNVYWVTVVEVRWYTLDGSCLPLFITPVFMLFALAVLNLLFLRFAPRQAFNQAELLVIYLMVVISETLAGHDFVQNLFGTIGHPFRFATPENRWEELFWQYIPRWLTVSDEIALRGLYEGRESFWQPQMYGPFLVPLAAWGSFLLVLIFVMLCINVLVRKPWTEHEKLSYPLILLPLEMLSGGMTPRESMPVPAARALSAQCAPGYPATAYSSPWKVNGVIGVLRGAPDLRPGTVRTIDGPTGMPSFPTATR